MALKANLDTLAGDAKKRAHDFISHIVNDLRHAVQASDIQKVRDLADELEHSRDMAVDAITATGPSHDEKTANTRRQAEMNDPKAGGDPNKNPPGTTQQPPGGAPGRTDGHRDSRA